MTKVTADKLDKFRTQTRNSNRHTQRGMGQLEASMRKYGYVTPMTAAADGEIIDGSARAETGATVFGDDVIVVHHDGTRPVIMVRDDIPSADTPEAREISIAANRIAQVNLDFDPEVLLADLQAGVDLAQFWRQDELDELLADLTPKTTGDTEPQIDRAEELREKWGVSAGQLWQLGEHRLVCGDCTDAATVARVMGGEKADTLVSDPPYGIGYEYDEHNDVDNYANMELIRAAWKFAPVAKVWTCGLMNLKRDLNWNQSAKVLVWHKGFAQAGNGLGGASTWEPVLVVGVKGGTLPDDYLHFSTDRIDGLRELHSCPKPIGLFEHLIKHLAGDTIYEPFSGSGTTIIACENLGRKCRAVEISPAYVAVALQRYADHTGREPMLVESGA